MEQTIFYILIFVIGTLFGSFLTLAVYRIPLHQDITHKRSYCPNCNHKLSFFDMIPILSYIFLKGKCRYCKQKIRARYIILEFCTGILFLLFAMSLNLHIFSTEKILYLIISYLYITGIIIIAGIDKERRQINKSVIIYEMLLQAFYIMYLYIVEKANVYRYVIYLFIIAILLIIENVYLKRKLKDSYPLQILQLSIIMTMFSCEQGYVLTVILTLFTIVIERILRQIKKKKVVKKEESYYKELPIGFYLCTANILTILVTNWFAFRG